MAPAAPAPAPAPAAASDNKWLPTFYGFVEADMIYDSTQSFDDLAGNASIARKGSYAGDNSRFTFGARNSRIGFKLAAPEYHEVRASAVLEMDFLGKQPTGTSESTVLTSPLFRVRHMAMKVETPYVDVLAGQTWQLFGWQPYFHPNTVQIQGVPGQIYSRSPQLRLSHVFKSDDVNIEIAAAAVRPAQRDAGTPDGQFGARVYLNNWKGLRTTGGTGTAIDSAALGISGLGRRLRLPDLAAAPKGATTKAGWGVSVDALLPIIAATAESRSNALSVTGSFVRGAGIADLYTGLSGGISYPSLPNPSNASPAPAYNSTIDPGLLSFDANGGARLINWQSLIVGAQYYLPIDNGHVWVSSNYSRLFSNNARDFVPPASASKVFFRSQWADANLFWDATPQLRLGAELAWFQQKYVDGVKAHDERVQLSTFYLF